MGLVELQTQLDALKRRHPLGKLVEASGIRLNGRGRVRQGLCPFHDDGAPSFTVYADSQRFHCFGCGVGGDVPEFVQRMHRLSFPAAVRWLDDGPFRARGVVVRSGSPVMPSRPSAVTVGPRDRSLLTTAARFYAGRLRRSPLAQEYLASRGIDLDSALRLGLGYAAGHGLRSFLDSAGFNAQRIGDGGLFMGRGTERFAGMVVVPDASGGLSAGLPDAPSTPAPHQGSRCYPVPSPFLGLDGLAPRLPGWCSPRASSTGSRLHSGASPRARP